MEFITLEDLRDEIVTCDEADVAEANSFLENRAKRLGVKTSKIVLPPVFTVKRLGVVYGLYNACVRNIGKDNLTSLDTESTRDDIYAQKARFLKEEMQTLLKDLCAADFADDAKSYGLTFSVPVRRG